MGATLAPLLGLVLTLASCRGPAGMPAGSPLEPLPHQAAWVPEAPDRAAHDLAVVALAGSSSQLSDAQLRLEALETQRAEAGEMPTGLVPYGQRLVDSALDDEIAYRRASSRLLERDDLDPALRKTLELEVADDPLRLAGARLNDRRRIRYGRAFNVLSEAAGRSMSNLAFAPVRFAQALLSIALAEHLDEPISLQERQALRHWVRYVETHPDSEETPKLLDRIEALQHDWFETKRERSVRAARDGLEAGNPEAALVVADRAQRYAPEDAESAELLSRAQAEVAALRARRARSLEAPAQLSQEETSEEARRLSITMLAEAGDLEATANALLAEDPDGPLAAEARFARAIARGERGAESAMWEDLEELRDDPDPIARHASLLVESPAYNPYAAFRDARAEAKRDKAEYVVFGHLKDGARDFDLPRPLEWMIEAPGILGLLGGIPARLVQSTLAANAPVAPAILARRYLQQHPDGEHAQEVRSWLVDFESGRGNYLGAHRLAREMSDRDGEWMRELEENAASQMLRGAKKQPRRDVRLSLLRQVASDYPDTPAGEQAGRLVHSEIENASAQRIRISHGFLVENPEVAGPNGLGLRPELIDGDPANGELHPRGVTLLGGRVLEFAMLAPSGDKDDEPETVRKRVSDERLSRLVALLEETALRNALLDPLAEHAPDADRDLFFERARLGVADRPDPRPTAESSYAFIGVRERYGIVRPRESVLPIEFVVQGSFPDLGLGAFPRLRMPKATPDAVLYR